MRQLPPGKKKKKKKEDKTLKPASNSTADYFHNQRRWFPFYLATESRNIQHFSVQSVVTQLCRDVNRHNELLFLVLGTFNFRVSDNFASTKGKKERNKIILSNGRNVFLLYARIRSSTRLPV